MDAQPQPAATEAPVRRKSVFMEVGLVDEEHVRGQRSPVPALMKNTKSKRSRPGRTVRFRSKNDIFEGPSLDAESDEDYWETDSESEDEETFPQVHTRQDVASSHKIYRLGVLAALLGLMLPFLQISSVPIIGVRGGVIRQSSTDLNVAQLESRQDSTQVCRRWAGQCKNFIPPMSSKRG